MMRPTEMLVEEHRVISMVLDCLEAMTDQADRSGELDWSSARQVVDFLQVFADQCHHHKEEDHLFPLMEARGFSREFGPTAVMLDEHSLARKHVQGMVQALEQAVSEPAASRAAFIANARAYLPLLRQHILKENHRLFPMADRVFSEEDQRRLQASFEDVEHAEAHAGMHARYLRIADELAERFKVARGRSQTSGVFACCGHHGCH
jgi:hemerythrin-like domain-containing protein